MTRRWRLLRGLSAGFMPGSMPAAASARRKEHLSETVIASEAKQSIAPQKGRMDCFAPLAMTRIYSASITQHARLTHGGIHLTDTLNSYVCGISDAPLLG